MAEHIEESAAKKGKSKKTAARIAWATVNKETGGAAGNSAAKKKAGRTKKKASVRKTK